MSMKWTKEQQSVLDVRNKNVLVSAAAGSGKTAVLVERIIKIVIEDNIDIDRLLVVTFTKAAAGEMRERVLLALEKKSKESPDNEHIQKQMSYIHNAQITTIDSFCLNIVRQYFNEIDIDPSFRIGDDGELKLLKADVMKELLETYYEEGNEDFLEFVNDYSSNRSDEKIEELIMKLYTFSMSYPYPEEWLSQNVSHYNMDEDSFENEEWYKFIISEIKNILEDNLIEINRAIEVALSEDGPFTYEEALRSDKDFLESLINQTDYDKRVKILRGFKPNALSRKRLPENTDERKKDEVKFIRDAYKKEIKSLTQKFYAFSFNTIKEDIKKCSIHVSVLTNLTKDYINLFQEKKREKNIIDFSDMEHLALQILTKQDENGKIIPTDIAMEISEEFEEIMIDEYQDSNLVQEIILNSVSTCYKGKNNIFMVGDVKQSIYKFRLARPELFLEKYDTYPVDDDHNQRRITLSKNFRSRKEVLDGANLIFSQIMSKELGGISYDEDNSLYYGANYSDFPQDTSVELMMLDTSDLDKSKDDIENKELEAIMVANRIKEMIKSGYLITDKKTGKERPVKYSDISILLRSYVGYGEVYANILSASGIPVKSPTGTGYFDTFEVETILNMLSIIDNPRQDIPLAAVMKNIFLFTDDELAQVKIHGKNKGVVKGFYECLELSDDEKVVNFIETINYYRNIVTYTSIHDLIEDILKRTGFGYFISSMKAGSLRTANIEMLKEKAVSYEDTSYSGLFNFVRYIENLRKYNVEQGEASLIDGGDFVTLLTIHKSKGLEYPIVFVGAMCKKFNKLDTQGPIVMHNKLGVGLNYLDRRSGFKATTLIKESIARQIQMENIAEELRVFYVALTRAKEKLFLVGNGNVNSKIKKVINLKNDRNISISKSKIYKANDYMEWVFMSLVRHNSFSKVLSDMEETVNFSSKIFDHLAKFKINIVDPQNLIYDQVINKIESVNEKSVFYNWNYDHVYNQKLRESINKIYCYEYPYKSDMHLSGKVSVSDIKHMFMKMYDEETLPEESEVKGFETEEKPVPMFISKDKLVTGALRGTAYHRIFELINYSSFSGIESDFEKQDILKEQLEEINEKMIVPKEYMECIDENKVLGLINSNIGKRMIEADTKGKLFREKQFVIGVSANNVKPEYSKEERVLVQGIVDIFFEEDGEIVVVDYKTDNVNNLKDLLARYETQLDYYGMALSQITGKKIKEKVLYSVKLNKELNY